MHKQLPNGTWFSIRGMEPKTTDVELQAYLSAAGIELPLENISITEPERDWANTSAVVSVPKEELLILFQRCMGTEPLRGRKLVALLPNKRATY